MTERQLILLCKPLNKFAEWTTDTEYIELSLSIQSRCKDIISHNASCYFDRRINSDKESSELQDSLEELFGIKKLSLDGRLSMFDAFEDETND